MADLEARAFRKRGKALIPSDYVSEEWLAAIPEDKEVLISWRKPRHPENHRHLMAILHLACEHLDDHADAESLLDSIKIACGHTRPIMLADGTVYFLPKSINFASLGEEEFKRFKNRALYVLSRILGFDAVLLLPEIDERNRRHNDGPPIDDRPEPPTEAYEEKP